MRAVFSVLFVAVIFAPPMARAGEKPEPWESVRVVGDSDQVEGCKLVGEVKGRSSWGGVMQSHAESKAYQKIKKNALKMGADTVLLLTGHSAWAGSKYRGEAYLCKPKATNPTPAPKPTPPPPKPTPG